MRAFLKRAVQLLVLLAVILGGVAVWKREQLTRLLAVNSLFDAARIVQNFSHMDTMFLTHPLPRGDGTVRVSRETKGRKGKGVTLISGVPLGSQALAALAKDLKQRCGTGGTVKDGVIEIQGDHCDRVREWLAKEGWPAKVAGG